MKRIYVVVVHDDPAPSVVALAFESEDAATEVAERIGGQVIPVILVEGE